MDPELRTTRADKRTIQGLLSALKPLSDLGGPIPLLYAMTFLAVASKEGQPISVYGHALDLRRWVIGRYMQCLGDRGRNGEPGLGLVTVKRTKGHQTRTEVFLTDKGRELATEILRHLRQ